MHTDAHMEVRIWSEMKHKTQWKGFCCKNFLQQKAVKKILSRFIGLGQLQDNKTVNKSVIYLGCALKTGNTLIIIIYDTT